MGRKKIQITRIVDERNRQVGIFFKCKPVQLYVAVFVICSVLSEESNDDFKHFIVLFHTRQSTSSHAKQQVHDSSASSFLVRVQRFLRAQSAVVTTGGEGSNLGLAGSGQHPVISRVGQHLGNTAALSPRRVLTLLPTGIPLRLPPLNISPPTAQQIPACLDQQPGPMQIEMWLESKYVQLCLYLTFGCLDLSFFTFSFG